MHNAALAAKALEIFPFILLEAFPTTLAWYINPYLGVLCFVLIALNKAFSAPKIWIVEAGNLFNLFIFLNSSTWPN